MVLWCTGSWQGAPNWSPLMPRGASLAQLHAWSLLFFQSGFGFQPPSRSCSMDRNQIVFIYCIFHCIYIVFSISRMIWNQTEFHLVSNQSENSKYNLSSGNSMWTRKEFICVSKVSKSVWFQIKRKMVNTIWFKVIQHEFESNGCLFSCWMKLFFDCSHSFQFDLELNRFYFVWN